MFATLWLAACVGQSDDLVTRLAAQEAAIEALQAEVAALRAELSLRETVDAHSSDVTALQEADAAAAATDADHGERLADAEARLEALEAADVDVDERASALEEVSDDVALIVGMMAPLHNYVLVDTANHHVKFTGANVYVQSGSGATDGAVNGLGNLIVGYDEANTWKTSDKSGSHNLIIGTGNNYSSWGSAIFGTENESTAPVSAVLGGDRNTVAYEGAVIVTGYQNEANAAYSAILNGCPTSRQVTTRRFWAGVRMYAQAMPRSSSAARTTTPPAWPLPCWAVVTTTPAVITPPSTAETGRMPDGGNDDYAP